MTFTRTNLGLSNLYLFFKVDAVVFVEGGQSISRDDVEKGNYTSSSSDIRFWQALFNIYRPKETYQFRAIGSKENVKSIANKINNGELTHVIATMDRDLDHINNRIIVSKNVIYTYGYSWENDCWCLNTILLAYCSLSGCCKNQLKEQRLFLEKSLKDFSESLRRMVYIDMILSQHNSSLFDRDKHLRYISEDTNGCPKINITELKKSIGIVRNNHPRPITKKTNFNLDVINDCFGHLFADFSYKLLTYLLRLNRNLPKIPKEYATGAVVQEFIQLFKKIEPNNLRAHYDSAFLNIII